MSTIHNNKLFFNNITITPIKDINQSILDQSVVSVC